MSASSLLQLPVVGADLQVPLVTGSSVRYVNLDFAASAPCLRSVADAVDGLLPWYSSVHRGAGFASTVTSEILAASRAALARFVGAPAHYTTVFTRNTTDALNLLATALPDDTQVVTFASEHHANLLPWRRGPFVHLPVPVSPDAAVDAADQALRALPSRNRLLAVAGASNVTGEVWPLEELARVVRRHGARLAVDAAQLSPHRAIDVAALGVDYLALSGHKLYAPFGVGALIGRPDWLDAARPYLAGGGAVRSVTLDETSWANGAARHEAGTPNVVGAFALGQACQALAGVGMYRVAAHEAGLMARLTTGLGALRGVKLLSMWGPRSERIGVVSFTVAGWHPGALAAALSAEYGIGVRDGAFCAHPLVADLLGASAPGAVRASIGVGTRAEDIERFLAAMSVLVTRGAQWRYRIAGGRYVPDPDPRPRPEFLQALFKWAGAPPAQPGPCLAAAAV